MNYNRFAVWFIGLLCIVGYAQAALHDLVFYTVNAYVIAIIWCLGGFICLCVK